MSTNSRRSSRCCRPRSRSTATAPPSPTWARCSPTPTSTASASSSPAYLLGELKLKKGDRVAIMMPNCLQYPIAIFGVLRAGPDRGQHQPDVHRARAEAPARRLRRRARSWCSTTSAHVVQEVLADTPGQAGHHHRPRRHARLPEGRDRQLRAAPREEDGAGLRHPRRVRFRDALDARRRCTRCPTIDDRPRGHRLPAVHRRHHRRGQGRDAHPPQPRRQHAAGRGVDRHERASTARKSSSPRCRCTTSSR